MPLKAVPIMPPAEVIRGNAAVRVDSDYDDVQLSLWQGCMCRAGADRAGFYDSTI